MLIAHFLSNDMSTTRELVVVIGGSVVVGLSSLWLYSKLGRKSKKQTITVIGDIFCDIIATRVTRLPSVWGTDTVVTDPITIHSGGSGLNTSVWLRNLLKSETFSDPVRVQITRNFANTNDFGSIVQGTLENAGVEIIEPISKNQLSSIGTCICLSGETDRSFVTFRGGNERFTFSDFDLDELVSENQIHVHIAGYYNCPGLWYEHAKKFIRECRNRKPGITISLNPQYGEEWGGGIHELLPLVDFLICNSVEAQGIASIGLENPSELVESAVKLVKDFGCPCAVITMGADGALVARKGVFQGDGTIENQICEDCTIQRVLCKEIFDSPTLDTVGVGDAFCAGFLSQIAKNKITPASAGLINSVRFGCACGSAALTVVGGSTFPGIEVVRACQID